MNQVVYYFFFPGFGIYIFPEFLFVVYTTFPEFLLLFFTTFPSGEGGGKEEETSDSVVHNTGFH
jgi:hypothetical protein